MSEYSSRPGTTQEPEPGTSIPRDQNDTGNVQDQAKAYAGEAREKASEYGEAAKEKAGEYGEIARERIETGKDQAAEGMERAAEMVRERTPDGSGVTAQAGEKVADGIESAAGYLRNHDMNEMWSDIESYARAHPTQALAGAVVAGFLVGRLIR